MAVLPKTWWPATQRIDKVQMSFMAWLATEDQDRQGWYAAYREYYDGDHGTQLSDRQRRYLQIKKGEEFHDNYCPIVVDALAERLTVTGFDAEGQGDELWQWWQANEMDRQQGQVHLAAIRDGDGYLLVDFDNEEGRPRFTMETAYDGIEGVKLHYDPEHKRRVWFASKRWRVEQGPDAGKMRRLNLYYEDRIEKYVSYGDWEKGRWVRYLEDDEDGESSAWPLPWTTTNGEPLGVPIIHFINRDQGYNYGQSELKAVVPLQNALNKAIIDLLAAADLTGFRLYTMTGADPGSLELLPGTWAYSADPQVKIGVIEGANLTGLIELKDSFAMEIARVSRTPLSYFQISGHRPAEGTLKAEESPLVSKADNRKVGFGDSWADTMEMARRVNNAFGAGTMDEAQIIEAIWKDSQTRNEKAMLETLTMKEALGVPWERLMIEMGYDQDTIDQMQAQRGEEMAATSNIGGELLRAFEGGQ